VTDDLAILIEGLPPLCHSLPYRFSDNTSNIENIEMCCAGCGKTLHSTDINGEFTAFNKYSVSLTAFGICHDCLLVTPIESKFSSDGTCLQKLKNGWTRGRWGQKTTGGLIARLKALFMSTFE
jgi:hypothetical protein